VETNAPPQAAPAEPWLVAGRAGSPFLQTVKLSQPEEVRTVTLPAPLLAVSDLRQGSSPQGGWLVVRTRSEAGGPLALVLVSLADGRVETISPLLSAELESRLQEEMEAAAAAGAAGEAPAGGTAGSGGANGPAVQARRAVEDPQALAWSPDGKLLAFVAAVDGPSSDLYVFNLTTRQIGRLTTGLNQAATPFWSSDSRWIVHQELKELQEDGRWKSVAVWAAAAGAAAGAAGSGAGSDVLHTEIRRLYTPSEEGEGEVFLAWTQDETLIVYSRAGEGGRQLREVPLSARWSAPVYSPRFAGAAVDSTGRELALLHDSSSGASAGLSPGLYRLHAYSGTPQLVLAGEWERVTWWDPPGLFTAYGPAGSAALAVQGEADLYPMEAGLAPSPDGKWIAGWGDLLPGGPPEPSSTPTSLPGRVTPGSPTPGLTPTSPAGTAMPPGPGLKPGVRLYQPGGPALQELTVQAAAQLLWAADSRSLFFLADGLLYQAAFPQAIPQGLGEAEGPPPALEGIALVP